MDTKVMSQFDVLDENTLATVEGGIGANEFIGAVGVCTVGGAVLGSVFPVVGTGAGAILGAQFCTGAWALIRH
ncbi:Blp family class II bacteriocin [Streptococcus sanguinis]|uniref:ComC/BlpC family leader-containing pheromone/bacteriocin n=1 Tax=Streptococcus sanguinis TaxID=1305 RepID=A0A7H8V667_STRSA|nr:Blp family class II bacteriocin [Streptococcus sanguinis]QLB49909.1 ComC/BlpC family leader-containing pheromone/bacteriocin [Streptococcus sanguinis]QLB52044.1 ComC/BlpC family leader-containing pheromone/bacteriocin [Streptococcus sanguinis]